MDFEGLFWIALVVFYFMSRVLGGKKRQKPSPHPTREGRSRPDRPSTGEEPELDEALREIRRALGFPVDEPEPAPQESPEPVATTAPRRDEARQSSELNRQRDRDAREAARQQELLERAEAADKRRAPAIPKPKVARRPGPIGAHPMESSFAEEEIFERTGRHPHEQAPVDYALQAPYGMDSGRRNRLKRRLRGRDSLREAFILKEVLDKPLSMRKRR